MTFKCKIGLHSWDGCKCSECGKTRDEQHEWSMDCEECSKCYTTRESQHSWNGCLCEKCKKIRSEQHDWSKDCCKCSKCGTESESNEHDFTKDCQTCSKCGTTFEKMWGFGHQWESNCEKCSVCGKSRKNIHVWTGCKCFICGREKHDWSADNLICFKCGISKESAHKVIGVDNPSFDLTFAIFRTIISGNSVIINPVNKNIGIVGKGNNPEWNHIKGLTAKFSLHDKTTNLNIYDLNNMFDLENVISISCLKQDKTPPSEFTLLNDLNSLVNCDSTTQRLFFQYFLTEMLITIYNEQYYINNNESLYSLSTILDKLLPV